VVVLDGIGKDIGLAFIVGAWCTGSFSFKVSKWKIKSNKSV
jgi:hypothetical protein